MSYILDALKKSEIERRAADSLAFPAGSSYLVTAGTRAGRNKAIVFVGAGMLAAGLALGGWQPWSATRPAGAGQTIAVPAAPVPVSSANPPVALLAEKEIPAPARPAAIPPAKPTAPAPAKGAPPTRVQGAPATAPATRAAPPRRAEAAPLPAPTTPSGGVVAYRDLPAEVRNNLPKVSFGGYAGVDETEVPIAFINNRLIKEGEEVSPGVKVETVGREGVVLGYKGHHFRPEQ